MDILIVKGKGVVLAALVPEVLTKKITPFLFLFF